MENLFLATFCYTWFSNYGSPKDVQVSHIIIADNIEDARNKASKHWEANIKSSDNILDDLEVTEPIR